MVFPVFYRCNAAALVALLCFSLLQSVSAEEPSAVPKPSTDAAVVIKTDGNNDGIAELIKQLDSNSFPERQAATEKLSTLGKSAVPALTEAALNGSRETITRAVELLKGHLKSSEDGLKTAAKTALEKIVSDGKGTAARQAEQALNPKKDSQPQGLNAAPNVFPFGGQVQIQMQVIANGGGNNKKVTTRTVNGVKTIEAEENGRKVKITDDPNNGIQMEVTETKDGKETTQKYEAKNAADLKEKNAEAHKLYEQYSQQAGNVQIQVVPGFGQAPGIPGNLPNGLLPQNGGIPRAAGGGFGGNNAPNFKPLTPDRQIEGIARQIEMLGLQLKQISDKNPSADELPKIIEALKKSREDLLEAKKKLMPEAEAKNGDK